MKSLCSVSDLGQRYLEVFEMKGIFLKCFVKLEEVKQVREGLSIETL